MIIKVKFLIFYVGLIFATENPKINTNKNMMSRSQSIRIFHGDSLARIHSNLTFLYPTLPDKHFSYVNLILEKVQGKIQETADR